MTTNFEPNRRDVEAAFRVLDGDESGAPADALSLASSAREQWRRARLTPEHVDFDALDRAVLRAVAEARLRTSERRQVTRVLFPGLAVAAALAVVGLVVASGFGAASTTDEVASEIAFAPPQALGVGTRLASGERGTTASVGVATVTLDSHSQVEVLTDEALLTRVSVGAGAAAFEVAPRPPGGRFEVVAGRATVTVVGTGFRVARLRDARLGERVSVDVAHGVVEVRSPSGQTVRLTRGQSVTVPVDAPSPETLATGDALPPSPSVVGVPAPDAPIEAGALPMGPTLATPTAPASVPTAADAPVVVAEAVLEHAPSAPAVPRARPARPSVTRGKSPASPAVAVTPVIVVPSAPPVAEASSPKDLEPPPSGNTHLVVETSEDDRAATERLRALVAGLGPATCSARVSELRQWIAEQPGHGRLRIGQHALAYCYHALGRSADADRLFRRLGFKLKDILEPKPPPFR